MVSVGYPIPPPSFKTSTTFLISLFWGFLGLMVMIISFPPSKNDTPHPSTKWNTGGVGGDISYAQYAIYFFIQDLYSEVKRALRDNYSLIRRMRTVIRPAWSAMGRPISFSFPFPTDSFSFALGDILNALGATCWGAAGSPFWGEVIPSNFFSNSG